MHQPPTWGWIAAAILGLGSLTVGGVGCGQTRPSQEVPPQDTPPPLTIVTTFLPMTQFTQAVAGDLATVVPLLPPNIDPHDFQARPEDVQTLANAQVLVKNGLQLETFLDGLIASANNPTLRIIDSSVGVTPILNPETAASDLDDDDHGHGHGGHEHEHGKTTAPTHDHSHDHGPENPHIWLDPKRAQQQVNAIRDGLIQADPAGAATYTANARAYVEQLQTLDQEITTMLAPYQGKTFVTYHDAAPYFAESYGLQATFLVGVPSQNPSPADVRRVIQAVQASDLKALMTEPGSSEAFTTLANDLGVRVSHFDALETTDRDPVPPDHYLTVMRQNAESLRLAFTPPEE
ncbi:MAG: metal ABC transporter substrate-binding protein [Synechococcales cyanobacterium]